MRTIKIKSERFNKSQNIDLHNVCRLIVQNLDTMGEPIYVNGFKINASAALDWNFTDAVIDDVVSIRSINAAANYLVITFTYDDL